MFYHGTGYTVKANTTRRGLVRVRRDYGLSPAMSDDEVRVFRYRLLVERPDIIDNDLGLRWDFFDLSRCRDLLFHPLEHRFTLPQVADYLTALTLQFRGLERPDIQRDQFWTHFPSDSSGPPSLSRWHTFEQGNPGVFLLYEIWARKPE